MCGGRLGNETTLGGTLIAVGRGETKEVIVVVEVAVFSAFIGRCCALEQKTWWTLEVCPPLDHNDILSSTTSSLSSHSAAAASYLHFLFLSLSFSPLMQI